MTFLSDEHIEQRIAELIIQDEDFERDGSGRLEQLEASSYELRLGKEVFLCGDKKLQSI